MAVFHIQNKSSLCKYNKCCKPFITALQRAATDYTQAAPRAVGARRAATVAGGASEGPWLSSLPYPSHTLNLHPKGYSRSDLRHRGASVSGTMTSLTLAGACGVKRVTTDRHLSLVLMKLAS